MVFRARTLSIVSALATGFAPVALAGNNSAHLLQGDWRVLLRTTPGENNSADIIQQGSGNHAGGDMRVLHQQGRDNRLDLRQEGENNRLGQEGAGFVQRSRTGGTASNSATIHQRGNGNIIGAVMQSEGHLLPGAGNVLIIEQHGGDGNRIDEAAQRASGPGGPNRMELRFGGHSNNTTPLTGFADQTGARAGHYRQDGVLNRMGINIAGDANALGAVQLGGGNRIGWQVPLTITGDRNQIGIAQIGIANELSLTITGDENNVGVNQNGADNSAAITLAGNTNRVSLLQDGLFNQALFDVNGHGNEIIARQTGVGNRATVTQQGNNNQAGITQIGASNTVTVTQ